MRLTRSVQAGILVAGGLIILVILSAFLGLTFQQNEMIHHTLHHSAAAYFENILITRRWNAQYGGVFAEKTKGVESNPYLENPDITSSDGRVFTKKNPALMTREISSLAQQSHEAYKYHITSLTLVNPANAPDAWERSALEAFGRGEKEWTALASLDGRKVYRLMRPLLYEASCHGCHAGLGLKPGDVRGGISVSLPYDDIERDILVNQRKMLALACGIVLVLAGVFYLLIWQLMKRLTRTVDELENERRNLIAAQDALAAERNNLDDIVSSIDADLLLLDRDMRILWVNRRLKERTCFAGCEFLNEPCNKAYCNIDHVPPDCPARQAFETGGPVRQEHSITHPDGSTRFYAFTCSPIRNAANEVTHVLELVQDITLRKEEELRHAEHLTQLERMKEDLDRAVQDYAEKNRELERLNRLFVDREFRIKELRDRIREIEGAPPAGNGKE